MTDILSPKSQQAFRNANELAEKMKRKVKILTIMFVILAITSIILIAAILWSLI
jgi:hypothetical protein